MKKKKQKRVKSKKDVLKVDLTRVKIDKKGRVIVNDPIVNKKVKSIQTKAASGQTKGPSDALCIDRKLCLDITCPHPTLDGCMPNIVGCGCPPLPKPNPGCIPLWKKTKGKKKESNAAKKP